MHSTATAAAEGLLLLPRTVCWVGLRTVDKRFAAKATYGARAGRDRLLVLTPNSSGCRGAAAAGQGSAGSD